MSSEQRRGEHLGRYQSLFEEALRALERDQVTSRIWQHDAALWKSDDAHQKIIRNALGWLTVARDVAQVTNDLETFAREVREAGFTHLMLLGMGGSSLCPEVLRQTFGQREGFPEMLVLDTTDPDTIASFEQRVDLAHTLFIVASKSGTTIEPLSFYKYFYDRVRSIKAERAGENFIAITDPGTLMQRMATESNFRRIFLNPPDIGGRYSALSYFGMVPAALMGININELLRRAIVALDACGATVPAKNNPAARLGGALGVLARAGRDKLTLVTDEGIASLGLWIEQLVAESTGKEGKGIVPVANEPLGAPEVYAGDRVFVVIHSKELDDSVKQKLAALEASGHPVIYRALGDLNDLGAEFFVWEFATAVAGEILGINPFDQPNVQESKDNTNKLLDEFKSSGKLPEQTVLASEGELKIYGATELAKELSSAPTNKQPAPTNDNALAFVVEYHLARIKRGDYVALLAYIQETGAHDELLQMIRTSLRDEFHVATTTGYGPRFLHSTGQLHKGGADNGVFIQITDEDATDLEIPGEPYTFGVLKQAQALGDFASLASRNRRAIRFHLGRDTEFGLKKLLDLVRAAIVSDTNAPNMFARSTENK